MHSTHSASVHPGVFVLSWIFFSNLTILFNKWLIDTAGFRYPVILTCWHMIFAVAATQVLARTTRLLDGRHAVHMTRRTYLRAVVPIGVLFSASMVCSTLVYLYLSVPFIQMLKAAAPAFGLFVGWLWGIEHPTAKTVLNIGCIIAGIVIASTGEVHFSWPGFLFQLGGLVFESVRVVMIQALFMSPSPPPPAETKEHHNHQHHHYHQDDEKPKTTKTATIGSSSGGGDGQLPKMDPLVGLYYYAPVCALANFVLSIIWEGRLFQWRHVTDVGPGMLTLNALVAFILNVSSVLLIGKTSGLVLILTGILKNILLVAFAVVFTGESITLVQLLGYTAALAGLVIYQAGSSSSSLSAFLPSYLPSRSKSPSLPTTTTMIPGFLMTRRKRFLTRIAIGFATLMMAVTTAGVLFSTTTTTNKNNGAATSWAAAAVVGRPNWLPQSTNHHHTASPSSTTTTNTGFLSWLAPAIDDLFSSSSSSISAADSRGQGQHGQGNDQSTKAATFFSKLGWLPRWPNN